MRYSWNIEAIVKAIMSIVFASVMFALASTM